ncbi:hypothetical protein [Ensifer adhaerens]|uniref:hypothetical protein n=1 Tax=Ensifer adhaerens TaxID=106592 RepID=UPI000CF19EC3|nr:hypothetical protein [Ensifer adhaerens]
MWSFITENKFVEGMAVIAAVVGLFFSAPLGMEGYFQYGLGVVAAFLGILVANRIYDKYNSGVIVAVILACILLSGFFYLYLFYNIDTPGLPIQILEGFLFTLFVGAFFCAARLVDRSFAP